MTHRVLVVDDDAMNREIVAEILGGECLIQFASSGQEALDKVDVSPPDLVLLDIMMPGLDGYETCKRLKGKYPHLKVLLVSAKSKAAQRIQGYEAGADDYVVKPFDPLEFLAKVRVHLRLRNAEEVSELRSGLVTMLAHETRTPLSRILSSVQLLPGAESDEERRDLESIILGGAQRLQTIFDRSMVLFKHEADDPPLEFESISLLGLCRSEVDRARYANPESVFEVLGDECEVNAHEVHLREAFGILLAEVAGRHPKVQVQVGHVDPEDGTIPIDLCDPSMRDEPAQRGDVFELFRVSDVKHHSEDLDLDLPIAGAIIRRHGGEVAAETVGEGGIRFHMSLPSAAVRRVSAFG